MPWKVRGAGHRYFYETRREGGRVVQVYRGGGPAGALAARLVAQAARERADRAGALQAERARLEAPEAALDALDRACNLAAEATLTAAGYHRLDHHPWSRRRDRTAESAGAGDGGRG